MLAALTKNPVLQIDKAEADVLSAGITNVARHYDIGGASQKTLDWFNLFQSLALVYGPRVFVMSQNAKERKAMRRADQRQDAQPEAQPQSSGFDPSMFQGGVE